MSTTDASSATARAWPSGLRSVDGLVAEEVPSGVSPLTS